MWLLAVGLSALSMALAEDQQRTSTRSVTSRRLLPQHPGLGLGMATTERGGMITIDGEDLILRKVTVEGPEMARIEVEDPEEEEEREYLLFASSERAGELAIEAEKEELLWGIENSDPKVRGRAAENVAERLGAENLVLWALGMEAGPGTTKVRSLTEWFALIGDVPWEHWANYDDAEADIEPHDDDFTESRILLGASVWDNMVEQLGWEPGVAYRTD